MRRTVAGAAAVIETLPDLLRENLDLAFVSINPSIYSAERGHYFARKSNKFWPCISRSELTRAARTGLGREMLGPEDDRALLDYGIGFTDLVKRPTARASDVGPHEFADAVHALLEKIERYRPRIACFHGVTGYRHVHQKLTGEQAVVLGLQSLHIGGTRLFVVPNPSGANAHFTREEQTAWYDRVAAQLRDCP
jgi:TDG/mug DNA glycosylase family protein